MKTSATNRKLRVLLTAMRNNTLIPRPEFQRRLVWNNEDKIYFLQTVLMGYPFPEIYIAAGSINPETGEGTEMLVDGQQRITTLYQYFVGDDDLKLKKKIQAYSELSDDDKIALLEYEVVVRDLGKKNIGEIKEIFERINSTKYALNAMEIHNSRYGGAFKQFADNFSQCDFFENNNVFSTNEIRRMKDLVFCLTIMVSILSTYFNRDEELEPFLETYNDEFELSDQLWHELQDIMNIINQMGFEKKSRAWKKSDLLTLFVEIHKIKYGLQLDLDWHKAANTIKDFFAKIDDKEMLNNEFVNQYRRATTSATNDRNSRIIRGKILGDLLLNKIQV